MKWDLYAIFFLESLVKNIFFFKKQKTKKNRTQNNVCTVQFIVLFAALRAWFYKTSQNTVLNYGSEGCPRVFSEIWSLCWHLVTIN